MRPYVLSGLIYAIARSIGLTLRIRTIGYREVEAIPGGKIYAGWHGRTLIAANLFKGKGVWTIISQSRDGEMQNRIFKKFGFNTIRGSTGRGGVRAAVEAIKVLRQGATMAFTPDGPRGPSGVVQGGIMLMAQKAGAALVPVGVSARPRWLAPTWDRYLVPWPFARAIMIFGDPIDVPQEASEEEFEAIRLRFESEMHRLEREAEAAMGYPGTGA
ncbi:MAG TPA: lysophospholipid acyltransferase family protein [Fimbriimonadaceae bacterium]|nr:lysophospholipid acyltransferase family protein [Fimbriimonadaceae bacterium]